MAYPDAQQWPDKSTVTFDSARGIAIAEANGSEQDVSLTLSLIQLQLGSSLEDWRTAIE